MELKWVQETTTYFSVGLGTEIAPKRSSLGMETAPQYREKNEKELALLSLLQGTQKVRPRRKGKGRVDAQRDRRQKRQRPRGSDTRSHRQTHELGSLKIRRQEPLKPEERKAGL